MGKSSIILGQDQWDTNDLCFPQPRSAVLGSVKAVPFRSNLVLSILDPQTLLKEVSSLYAASVQ